MSLPLVLYDDARARAFEPFALTRPGGELRAGAELVRQRWVRAAGERASGFVGAPHLSAFEEFDAPPSITGVIPAGSILANTRFAPALDARLGAVRVWRSHGHVAAVRLAVELDVAQLADGTRDLESLASGDSAELTGWWMRDVWDFIRHLDAMLKSDIAVLGPQEGEAPPGHLTVLGEHAAFVVRGAYVEPSAFADTSAGPVLVRGGARVCAFTRLVGPCVIGEHSVVLGGKVTGCSVGDHARVHGEMSTSVMIGHANKSHDGFVGHSMIGRWANLGAGTITSNLKNSYGEVSLWTPAGVTPTGLQFLGSFVGDHAKTGIGTRLTTGTVVGAGANIFGSAMPPKFVPPYAWGDAPPFDAFELDKFLEVASRVMGRRETVLSDGQRRTLTAAFTRRNTFTP